MPTFGQQPVAIVAGQAGRSGLTGVECLGLGPSGPGVLPVRGYSARIWDIGPGEVQDLDFFVLGAHSFWGSCGV